MSPPTGRTAFRRGWSATFDDAAAEAHARPSAPTPGEAERLNAGPPAVTSPSYAARPTSVLSRRGSSVEAPGGGAADGITSPLPSSLRSGGSILSRGSVNALQSHSDLDAVAASSGSLINTGPGGDGGSITAGAGASIMAMRALSKQSFRRRGVMFKAQLEENLEETAAAAAAAAGRQQPHAPQRVQRSASQEMPSGLAAALFPPKLAAARASDAAADGSSSSATVVERPRKQWAAPHSDGSGPEGQVSAKAAAAVAAVSAAALAMHVPRVRSAVDLSGSHLGNGAADAPAPGDAEQRVPFALQISNKLRLSSAGEGDGPQKPGTLDGAARSDGSSLTASPIRTAGPGGGGGGGTDCTSTRSPFEPPSARTSPGPGFTAAHAAAGHSAASSPVEPTSMATMATLANGMFRSTTSSSQTTGNTAEMSLALLAMPGLSPEQGMWRPSTANSQLVSTSSDLAPGTLQPPDGGQRAPPSAPPPGPEVILERHASASMPTPAAQVAALAGLPVARGPGSTLQRASPGDVRAGSTTSPAPPPAAPPPQQHHRQLHFSDDPQNEGRMKVRALRTACAARATQAVRCWLPAWPHGLSVLPSALAP